MNISIANKESCKPIIDNDGNRLYELLNSSQSHKKHSLAYFELLAGNSSELHYHPSMEETYYILSGFGEILLDGKIHYIKKNDTIYIPVNMIHQIVNSSDDILILLTISVPGWKPNATVVIK